VQIVAEKAHNKFITRISGLEPFKVEVDKLGSYFQNKFATSATVSELPGKGNNKVGYVLLSGNYYSRNIY
jgi:translation initiation factor 1 (eIF-1/SUI1)